jgi:predicted transcriptional regulator of viral defense system
MENIKILQDWVTAKMIRGQYIFTKEDIKAIGLPISDKALINNLMRISKRGVIMSPWQNFYVTIPTEYKLKGVVPPSFYIDKLMKFLGRNYYVALLTAAAFEGATHQRTMVFQTMVNGSCIRSGVKNGIRLEFTAKKNLPLMYVHQVKTQTGYMNVADAELTALDIVAEEKKVGGLSRATEVLIELAEEMKLDDSKLPLLNYFTTAVIQRLGYLLDFIEERNLADALYGLLIQTGRTFRKVPLKQSMPVSKDISVNERWKIIENYKLEIDEI